MEMNSSKGGLNNLKRKLQDLIDDIDDYSNAGPSSSHSTGSSSDHVHNPGSSKASASFASRAADNFRRAFPALTRPQRGLNHARKGGCSPTFFVKNTFTVNLCCLSENGTVSPNSKEMYDLSSVGLGKKRHAFKKDGDHNYLRKELEALFPKLKAADGKFLLHRTLGGGSGKRSLHKIPLGPEGYTIKWLQDNIAIGAACIYVVPFEDLVKEGASHECKPANSDCMPVVTCTVCHEEVPLNVFEDHKCKGNEIEEVTAPTKKTSLKTLDDVLNSDSDQDDYSFMGDSNYSNKEVLQPSKKAVTIDLSQPGPSHEHPDHTVSSTSKTHVNLMHLKDMFPDLSLDVLSNCLADKGSLAKAALSLSGTISDDATSGDDSDLGPVLEVTLKSLIDKLQTNFSGDREKLKVDKEDLFNDAVTYYKEPAFDPKKRLRVMYKGQPAADTGGVTRQFYSQLLDNVLEMFFVGEVSKIPIYNADIVASGMMKLIGVMIVHSVLQGGPGFPVFSMSTYQYLVTGNIEEAMQHLTVQDCSLAVQRFIQKVNDAEDLSLLDQEEVTAMLSECGLPFALTNENKQRITQGIVMHDCLGKPKIVLDQLRLGLKTLGFASEMSKYPELFQELFLQHTKDITPQDVMDVLKFPIALSPEEEITKSYIVSFMNKASPPVLKLFLLFSTGCSTPPNFGFGRIAVKFETSVTSIFASTCLKSVTFPCAFPNEELFNSMFTAVLKTSGKAFNCV